MKPEDSLKLATQTAGILNSRDLRQDANRKLSVGPFTQMKETWKLRSDPI